MGISIEDKVDIDKVMADMTLEEKARLINGATFFGSADISRLGISRMQLLDGGTGINFEQLFGDMLEDVESTNGMVGSDSLVHVIEYFFEPERLEYRDMPLYNTIRRNLLKRVNGLSDDDITPDCELAYAPGCYPPGILLGSTWDTEVVKKVGRALGIDSVIFGVDFLLGSPNVNIHRDPLNGRLFEGYSEDPFLVSSLAPGIVEGVQEFGVAANVKHFAANNQETYRCGIDESVSERALKEIYLPGFKACVDAGARTVMSAYNKINGVACTENIWLLDKVLRKEWGFDGMVVSDWGAVYNPCPALCAGNDLVMPGPADYKPVYSAVLDGSLSVEILDTAVRRILETINWIADNKKDNEYIKNMLSGDDSVSDAATFNLAKDYTDEVAYEAAVSGIVLLKNDGILPLSAGRRLDITGSVAYDNCGNAKAADTIIECGSGSAGINTDRVGSLRESFSAYVTEACLNITDIAADDGNYVSDTCMYIVRIGGMEGNDRTCLRIPDADIAAINKLCDASKKVILVLNTCGPVEFTGIDMDKISAVLVIFLPGMGGCDALADIIFGEVSPSGKLPLTFPVRYEDTPTFLNFPGDGYLTTYGEGIYVGYRYYDKKGIKPMYPFGYGLSYAEFEKKLKYVKQETWDIIVTVNIENVSDIDAAEVIQIYVADEKSFLMKPVKELKAFRKVYLKAHESCEVTLSIPIESLSSFDQVLGSFVVEEGYYRVIAATSSSDMDVFGEDRIYIDVKSPYSYGMDSTIKTVYENSELKNVITAVWNELGLDIGILNSNYQYTSHKTIREIVPDKDKAIYDKFEESFLDGIKDIKKL